MGLLRGTTVKLRVRKQVGTDGFNRPVYETNYIDVENVLIGEPSSDEITTTLTLTGKKVEYTLAIPKGNTNNWEDTEVVVFGEIYRTIGKPTQGIEENIPLSWNKKVRVGRYE